MSVSSVESNPNQNASEKEKKADTSVSLASDADDKSYRIDFSVVIKEIGGLGRYQILLVLLAYWVTIPSGINQVASVFLAATPDFR